MQNSVTWKQVAAFRLAQHHLSARASTRNLLTVADDMIGAQAQLFSAAQISLWSRVHGLRIKHVEEAINQRTLVKAACMRRTLFLVPAKHLATFVRGSARRAEKEIRWARGKGVPDRVIDAAINAALDALDEPLTRPEIADRVSQSLGVRKQNVQGGGWGSGREVAAVPVGDLIFPVVYLLHLAGARGVICYGPNRDNEPTFVRADTWIPQWQDLQREEAEGILLHKYLRAFGPATIADFSAWAGISLTEAREIWVREQADFATVDVEGWTATILQDDLDKLTRAKLEHPLIRLLPYFDTFLLAHKDRQHIVDLQHQPKVFRPQGWIAPVVLVDGRVVAAWKYTQAKSRLLITVEKFEPMSRNVIIAIHEEARDLGRFLQIPDIDIEVG